MRAHLADPLSSDDVKSQLSFRWGKLPMQSSITETGGPTLRLHVSEATAHRKRMLPQEQCKALTVRIRRHMQGRLSHNHQESTSIAGLSAERQTI